MSLNTRLLYKRFFLFSNHDLFMKTRKFVSILLIFIIGHGLSSCTVVKRKYLNGYHVQWRGNPKMILVRTNKTTNQSCESLTDRSVKSASESTDLTKFDPESDSYPAISRGSRKLNPNVEKIFEIEFAKRKVQIDSQPESETTMVEYAEPSCLDCSPYKNGLHGFWDYVWAVIKTLFLLVMMGIGLLIILIIFIVVIGGGPSEGRSGAGEIFIAGIALFWTSITSIFRVWKGNKIDLKLDFSKQ